ncbi:MAG: sensor histidine kinase [Chitinispirillaceae bacterium]
MWSRLFIPLILCVLIFFLDIMTPLGFRIWILYIIPLLLSYRSEDIRITYTLLISIGTLLALGMAISQEQIDLISISILNRVLGFITFTVFTIIINRLIISRKNLRTYSQKLSAANQDLEAFSYSLTHDLRNPLSIITMSSCLLIENREKLSEEDQQLHTEEILNSSRNMTTLIQDMLALFGISRRELQIEEVDLSKLVFSIMHDLQALDPGRKGEFIVQKGVIVRADAHLMRIAMTNLLENAWKYASLKPEARIEFGARENREGSVYFVKDNGMGFDMGKADQLFEPFRRLHSREVSGTGIGLAIVQRVIRRHGGRIWAQSRPGKGAVFYFTLGEV